MKRLNDKGKHNAESFDAEGLTESLTAAQQVIADQVQFTLPKKQWKKFCDALDAPPKKIPALRRLLTKPGLFDANH